MLDAHASKRAGERGWRSTLVAVCVAQATAIAGFDFTLPFIPLYLQRDLGVHGLGQTALWAGLIGFGPAIPATIFGPLWGRLADRAGYRFMLLRAMLSAALLITVMGFAPSPAVLLVLRMMQGALTGTVFAAQALVAASVPERDTARAMGVLQMSVYVGATFGPVGGGAVASAAGYRAAFITAGVLLALATLVVFTYVREPERKRVASESESREKRPSMASLLVLPAFLSALVLTSVVQIASTALLPLIPLYVQELLHTQHDVASQTGWILALSGVAAAGGSYVAGRAQRYIGLKPLLIASIASSALLFAPQAIVHNYVEFMALRAASAFTTGALFSLVGMLAAVSTPAESKGVAFGMLGAASSMGFGAGPMLGGSLAGILGIRPLFVLSAVLLAFVPAAVGAAALVRPALRIIEGRPEWARVRRSP